MGKPDPRIKIVGKSDLELKIMFILNRVSKKQKENRIFLKEIMTKAGFNPVSYEWWHFDAFSKNYIRNNFGCSLKSRHDFCLTFADPFGMIYIGLSRSYDPNQKDSTNVYQQNTSCRFGRL